MRKLILFFKKIYVLLLFIVLESLALHFYAGSTSYTKAKLLGASNAVVGSIYKQFADIGDYFGLRHENDVLLEELTRLRNEFEVYRATHRIPVDSLASPEGEVAEYIYSTAYVINNSITRQENYIMLDKGRRDGVEPNMALVTPEGTIVGYVLSCRNKFSVAISVLNTNFRTVGKIKGKESFGSIYWDGRDHSYVTLSEIPKYTEIQPGDTIVTGYSSIFPPNLEIGRVESSQMNPTGYYDVKVKLTTRMSGLKRVFLVRYADAVERMLLEEEVLKSENN